MPLTIPVENWALRKSPRSSMGSWSRPLVPDEEATEQDGGGEAGPTISAEAPTERRTEGDGGEERHHRREEHAEAGPVEAHPCQQVAAAGHQQDGGHRAEQAEGDVDEEDEAPPARREQQAADVGPRARPSAWAAPCSPMARPSELPGTTSTMMARLFACSIAAPTAWQRPEAAQRPEIRAQGRRAPSAR